VLRDVAPNAATVGVMVNPNNPSTEFDLRDIHTVAASIGVQIVRVNAGSERDFDKAPAELVEWRVGALVINSDVFFFTRRVQLVELAGRLAVPAIFEVRVFVTAGGLMSYGTSIAEAYHKAGVYTGRIVRGEKPSDLDVVCPTSMPSLSSSPCIRGAPQSGFARLISRIKQRMSGGVPGRPPRGQDFQRQ